MEKTDRSTSRWIRFAIPYASWTHGISPRLEKEPSVVASLNCTLADLYDPLTMPPDLRAAHEANDRAVLAAYGLAPDTPEPEIVAHLFKLYADKMKWCG